MGLIVHIHDHWIDENERETRPWRIFGCKKKKKKENVKDDHGGHT